LQRYNQYICRRGKIPVDYRTGVTANPLDAGIWADRGTVETAAALNSDWGIGFVFTENDPLFFLDIDNAAITGGQWSPLAHELVAQFKGAYVEVSTGGRGFHIIGAYSGELPVHTNKNSAHGLELYTDKRYVALTAAGAVGDSATDCTPALLEIIEKFFKKSPARPLPPGAAGEELADDEIIKKALSAKNPFKTQNNFRALWERDEAALAVKYPAGDEAREYDYSSADAALAQHLAFWTNKNPGQIERIMRQSALVREKWARADYLARTIAHAIERQEETYKTLTAPIPEAAADAQLRAGMQFLSPAQQVGHFKGCVYIQDIHRAFIPAGDLLKPEQFKAVYGGYIFALDSMNAKTTTNAWQAFTESQAIRHPRAQTQCFRPKTPAGAVIAENGRQLVNTYVPILTPRTAGNPAPFLAHLRTILPDERDRGILLAYMSACVQHIGVKFQWAPLIQGVEGNGKTLFTRCVAAAIGRKYVHFPKSSDLDNKFNAWLLNKLFVGVEDIYIPEDRGAIIETLKPMITGGDGIEIQAKGVDQITSDICANFIINSNHRDALRKTRNDRRFCVFYCAQQEAGDLIRDGLGGDYFPRLYEWLRGDGYAIVHNFLAEYKIPHEFNPANGCHRAPDTSTTQAAIDLTLGMVEQEILEAIGEGRPGFRGGWVSSIALGELIKATRRQIASNRRREIMWSLGYDWHAGLPEGRVSSIVMPDGGKPKLFIKVGHADLNLRGPSEIAAAYTRAQVAG